MKSDVRTTFCPNFDFTVKALMISNSLYHRNFQTKTDMKVKIYFHAKLCMQNKILASKMRNLKQQKTSVFAPLILKRWIVKVNLCFLPYCCSDFGLKIFGPHPIVSWRFTFSGRIFLNFH